MSFYKKIRFLGHDGNSPLDGKKAINQSHNINSSKIKNSIKCKTRNVLLVLFLNYGGITGYNNINNTIMSDNYRDKISLNEGQLSKNKIDEYRGIDDLEKITETKKEAFGGVTLSRNSTYDVPGISKTAKSIRNREFPNVKFGNCRLTKGLGRIVYENAFVGGGRRETHQETYYSQRVLPGGGLNIPGRHIAQDGTVRDGEGFIAVAAPLNVYPKGTKIMTTLGPGKVYDTGHMKGKSIDIYVNW